MPFSKLGISSSLAAPLVRLGYNEPTPVQTQAIPVVLTGADLLARAQTGTGKTAAFGLPMIERLFAGPRHAKSRAPRALVLVPTRELALQVHKSLATFGAPVHLRVAAIFGGVSMGGQINELRHGTDIVVATPGRLIDHLQRRTIDLSSIAILTLDEADRMLDMGFQPALKRILPALPRVRQNLLFSATLSNEVVRLAADFTKQPVRIDVSEGVVVASTVTHQVHPVALERKRDLLTHVLTQAADAQTLVFCKTKRGADRVGDHLERARIATAVIHGNKSQGARVRALGDFKAGRVRVLVATDIAARGLDIAQLPLVVNYDLPLVADDYIHRVGRTGRAGHSGRAISLVSSAETPLLRDIQRLLPEPVEQTVVAGFEPGHEPRGAQQPHQPHDRSRRPSHYGGRPGSQRQPGRHRGQQPGTSARFGSRSPHAPAGRRSAV